MSTHSQPSAALSSKPDTLPPPSSSPPIPIHVEELHHTVPSAIKLASRAWGCPVDTAQTCILGLHGWLDNAATFDLFAPRVIEHLADAGIRDVSFVALDLAGHGQSSHRTNELYYLWDHIDDVLGFVDEALGWSKFWLIGHSMGGHISMMFSACYPSRVSKLVLIESVGPIGVPTEDHTQHLRDYITRRRAILATGPSRKPKYPSVDEAAHTRGSKGITPLTDQAARILCTRGLEVVRDPARRGSMGSGVQLAVKVENEVTWTTDQKLMLRPPFRWSSDAIQGYAKSITCPICLVFGNSSTLFQNLDSGPLKERLDMFVRRTVRMVTGGHHPHLEPTTFEETSSTVADFLMQEIDD